MIDYKSKILQNLNEVSQQSYLQFLEQKINKYKYICVFGAGNLGQECVRVLKSKGISVNFFCDNDISKIGNKYMGLQCISLNDLIHIKDDTIVIIATRYYKEIYHQLNNLNFKNLERIFTNKFGIDTFIRNNDIDKINNQLKKLIDILEDEESRKIVSRIIEEWITHEYKIGQLDDIYSLDQYFCKDLVYLSEHEIFVDGGAYVGDTLHIFLEKCNYNFDKAYLFELNQRICNDLKKNINKYDNSIRDKIVVYNRALAENENEIFYNDNDEGSKIHNKGNQKGTTVSIDSVLNGQEVTFIKMDIEGAELMAIKGAEYTIKKYQPKLAICLYHNPEDLWEIPIFIKKLVPNYKIYIRHHTDLLNETVCYAIPR